MHLAFYENFAENPKEEISKLFTFLGEPYDDKILDAVKRPSEVTRPDAAILTGKSIVGHWQDEVGAEQTRRSIDILRRFGLDALYDEQPMPKVDADHAFFSQREPATRPR
ncbi:MAG TPA: hypothetical protein VFF43_20430, partial [Caldimonas sp.]|nr:hypothetical protein [Caldimonas sp.]